MDPAGDRDTGSEPGMSAGKAGFVKALGIERVTSVPRKQKASIGRRPETGRAVGPTRGPTRGVKRWTPQEVAPRPLNPGRRPDIQVP